MGRRSDFLRRARDTYDTPWEAVEPLLPYLPENVRYIEPAAGAGALAHHLSVAGHTCDFACDIEPRASWVIQRDFLKLTPGEVGNAECAITNPPWNRGLLHDLLDHMFRLDLPIWLLLDANYMFTQQAGMYLRHCPHIVTIGRVKWIEGTTMTGKDDAAWFLFMPDEVRMTIFTGHPRGGHGWQRHLKGEGRWLKK